MREKNAVHILRWLGYTVMTLGKPVPTTCPKCRTFHWAHTTGNTEGVADVVVSHPTYWVGPDGRSLGLWRTPGNKKSSKADRRKEQIELANKGLSTIYVTEEQAVRAVIDVERRLGLPPNPKLLNWLEQNVPAGFQSEPRLI